MSRHCSMRAVLGLSPTFPDIVVKNGDQENSRQTETKDFVSGAYLLSKATISTRKLKFDSFSLLCSSRMEIAGVSCIGSLSRHDSIRTVGARSPTIHVVKTEDARTNKVLDA